MAIKITRTLYVGLGGTGVKAILRTKQCFLDAYGEIPQMIGFLAIDTNLASKNESVLRVDGKEHVYLNNSEIVVCTDSAAFTKYHQLKSAYQWMPESNVDALKTITSDGAGQVRSNGRFICITNSNTISTALRHKIAELAAPLPQGYRFEYDVDTTTQVATQTVVNVVGSVAGGTGSGMFIDVLALLDTSVNQMGNANVEIRPWLVLPDIFRQQYPGPLSFNVFKNAYGALREFDNLMEHKATQAPINFHYAQLNGLQHATYAFVVSNANSIQNLQKIDDITDSIGRSMFLPATQVGGDIDGIMLTNGPGDPSECVEIIAEIKKLYESDTPIFAICLGHQLMALANGAKTEKMKYGHRGANHPVKDLATGKVYISSQNHGYVVVDGSIDESIAETSFINVNDGTVEGVHYLNKNIFTVQFHPEACAGPVDSNFLFDEFINMMEVVKHA